MGADRCRQLLRDIAPGNVVAGVDAVFLAGVLERHPEAARKIGPGVAYFSVQLNPTYGNPGFWLQRIDGSATDFSFLKCLRRQSRTQVLMRALRRAVAAAGLTERQIRRKLRVIYGPLPAAAYEAIF